ncbi:MAG: ATP-binding protein [Betaproteobacteria bacterium]|nr:ATP-binding protein [Betaproteobacteria bacterium]
MHRLRIQLWPRSLYGRTAATLGIAFFLLQAIVLTLVFVVIFAPLARRSADDLAALIVLSAQTWAELPPGTRPAFEEELSEHHHLLIHKLSRPDDSPLAHFSNSDNIERALSARTGQHIQLQQGKAGWVWADLWMGGHLIRVSFEERRYYIRALLTTIGLISLAALLTWATSLLLVRRIAMRLTQMSLAAAEVGRGHVPHPLPEDGASELATLGQAFNRMATEVQDLLANRTTLLAGISHDLRTPIARMRLAVAMLPPETDTRLVRQIEGDLEQMNQMIGSFLDLARGMQHEVAQPVDIRTVLERVLEDARRGGGHVHADWPAEPCVRRVAQQALQRIVANLVENATRYGRTGPAPAEVTISCRLEGDRLRIDVMDRGPGIAADQLEAVFRPFYRLEQSRNLATGGSGLGLAIARQLATLHNWTIRLAAREGGGLTASLWL